MGKRKTIGVVVGGVTDDFTHSLSEGIKEASKKYNVNFILLPGKFLDRDYAQELDIMYEYQYGTLFYYATKQFVDGIIVAANCIGCYTTNKRLKELLHIYDGLPCVLVASQIDGYVSANFDNYKGIHDGLSYLIEELNCTKIGMIGGPPDISDSIERKATYEKTLWEHGIEPDPKLYVEGNMTGKTPKVFAKLLDDNPDLQAVFCVNDEVAGGFYDELKKRNLMPGRDVSVLGYDNMDWCSQIFPTLSSVSADASILGAKAVEMLLKMMDGENVESLKLPTQFVRRNSFCRPVSAVEDTEEVMEKYLTMNHWLDEQREKQNRANFEMKHFIMKILRFEKGTDQSYGEILGTMDWLGIHNALLFTYETPIIHLNHEAFELPEAVYLKAVLHKGKVRSIPAIRQKISVSDIYDMSLYGIKEKIQLVALPLYANEMLYGIFLCDLTEGVLENGEFLSNQVSAAVKMINLLKTNEHIMMQLEESLTVLQQHNLELDTLSRLDPLTGIGNRRGFFHDAEPLLKACHAQDKELTVMYIDMNNLKIINDRYGHDEGDFSLKTIARILVQVVGNKGVVARIGGDEYACALITDSPNEEILNQIYDSFTEFNESSDKPYNVTISAGAYRLSKESAHSLEDAMTLADEQLYEVKKLRKKDVAKNA